MDPLQQTPKLRRPMLDADDQAEWQADSRVQLDRESATAGRSSEPTPRWPEPVAASQMEARQGESTPAWSASQQATFSLQANDSTPGWMQTAMTQLIAEIGKMSAGGTGEVNKGSHLVTKKQESYVPGPQQEE